MSQDFFDKPHRRFNPLTNEWILVSPHRTKRPWQGKVEDSDEEERLSYDPDCYLCPGNTRSGGAVNEDYSGTFTFVNDFGALLTNQGNGEMNDGLLKGEVEEGICKVLCFSPNHSLTMAEMSVDDLMNVVSMWMEEYTELGKKEFISNVQIFENKGPIMGCSNPHPHGQIWAQKTIPTEIQKRIKPQQDYFEANGKSLLSDYLDQELESGERIIYENELFVSLVPFWATWPYEAMIIPKRHFSAISDLNTEEVKGFAEALSATTIKYDNLFKTSFPYSAGIMQKPTNEGDYSGWHFHYSFYPPLLRSATVKKFMVGYEMFANPQRDITAEQAAKALRELPAVHYKDSR